MLTEEYRQKLTEVIQAALKENKEGKLPNSTDNITRFIESLPKELNSVAGGNTTSLLLEAEGNHPIILDMGSGARVLGDQLMAGDAGKGKAVIHIFITHTHWDHICGIPFFKPLYIPGNDIHFYSPFEDLHERLRYQQDPRFFPKEFDQLAANKVFHLIKPESPFFLDNGLEIDSRLLRHPGSSCSYKFIQKGKSFVFATDVEFTGGHLEEPHDGETRYFEDTDLLVIDSQYTLDESFQKFEWGHTSYTMVINLALSWRVKNVFLTHHEPAYNDNVLYENCSQARIHRDEMGNKSLNVQLACEGESFKV